MTSINVVEVKFPNSDGTGILIANGLALTAGHCSVGVAISGKYVTGQKIPLGSYVVTPYNSITSSTSGNHYYNVILTLTKDSVDYYNLWTDAYDKWKASFTAWQATNVSNSSDTSLAPVLADYLNKYVKPIFKVCPYPIFSDFSCGKIGERNLGYAAPTRADLVAANADALYVRISPPRDKEILSAKEAISADSVIVRNTSAKFGSNSAGLALFYDKSYLISTDTMLPGSKIFYNSDTARVQGTITAKTLNPGGRGVRNFGFTTAAVFGNSGSPFLISFAGSSYLFGNVSATSIDTKSLPSACAVASTTGTSSVTTSGKGYATGLYLDRAAFDELETAADFVDSDPTHNPQNLIVGVERANNINEAVGTKRRDLFIGTDGKETFYASNGDTVDVGSGSNAVIFVPDQAGYGGDMEVEFGRTSNGAPSGNTVVDVKIGANNRYVLNLKNPHDTKTKGSARGFSLKDIQIIAGGQTLYWFPGADHVSWDYLDSLNHSHIEFIKIKIRSTGQTIVFDDGEREKLGQVTKLHDGTKGLAYHSPLDRIILNGKTLETKDIIDKIVEEAKATKGANLDFVQAYGAPVGTKMPIYISELNRTAFGPNPIRSDGSLTISQTPTPVPRSPKPLLTHYFGTAQTLAGVPDIAVSQTSGSPSGASSASGSDAGINALYGTTGADTLDSAGNYSLVYGEGGDDTFIYGRGYGAVTISEADIAMFPHNVLQLGEEITAQDTTISADDGGNLTLDFGAGDSVVLSAELLSANGTTYGVQSVSFSDGTVWTYADLLARLGTPSVDRPILWGDASANVMDGGGLSQTLVGNGGGDTFTFNRGYGELAIEERDGSSAPNNILQLGAGLLASKAIVTADSNGTITLDFGGDDQVWLVGALNSGSGTTYGVQQIRFADGLVWTQADLIARLAVASTNSATLYGDYNAQSFDSQGISDTIVGGGGGDTIIYNRGYGALTIAEADSGSAPSNLLQIGQGITAATTMVTADANGNLILDFGSGDTITLVGALESTTGVAYGIQTVEFADGTTWHYAEILAAADVASVTNTTLYGDYGANVLDGKGVASTLVGNGGGDTFVFEKGYGALTINEADNTTLAPRNVLMIGAGISASSLTVTGDSDANMILSFGGGDQITLVSGLASYNGMAYGVQQVIFADGPTLSYNDLLALAGTPSATHTTLYGDNSANILDGEGVASTLIGGGGGDAFIFIQGYGTLTIDETDTSDAATNVLVVGSGISVASTAVTADASGSLILDFGGNDRVILRQALNSSDSVTYGIQQINFQDGTSLSYAQLLAMADTASATNTTLYGDSAANTLDGQGIAGTLVGNGGGDTFIFNQGYGAVTIVESDPAFGDINALQLGAGLTIANAIVTANVDGDLLLDFGGGDVVTIQGALNAGQATSNGIQRVSFADGATWTYAQMLALADTGSASNTALYGDGRGDGFDSKGFAFTIDSTGGGDVILYNQGYGALTINEIDASRNADNVLLLGAGITENDVTASSTANGDIILSLGGSDVITLTSAMRRSDDTAYGVQNIRFASGAVWNINHLRYQLDPTSDGMALADGYFASTIDTDVLDGGGYARDSFQFTDSNTNNWHDVSIVSVSAEGTVPQNLNNAQMLGLLHAYLGQDTSEDEAGSVNWSFSGAKMFDYLVPGESVTLTYVVAVSDGQGGELRQVVSVTVTGSASNGHEITLFAHGVNIDYAIGRGALEIADAAGGLGADTTLAFGLGITLSMLTVTANQDGDLILNVNDGQSDRIVVESALLGNSRTKRGVQQFTFADGSTCTYAQLLAMADIGSAQNANGLFGDFNANIFDTGGFSHQISGRGGADTILYNRGYGSLYINEADGSDNRATTLIFGAEIDPSDVTIQAGSDLGSQGATAGSNRIDSLILNVAGSGRITITGMLSDLSGGVQSVQFQDGTVWSYQHMVASLGVLHPSGYPFFGNGVVVGGTGADTLDPAGTARYVEGNGGGDTIVYNRGYGALNIIEIDQTTDTNRLAFGQGIDPSDVTVTMTGVGSFVLSLGGGDVVTFQGSGGAAITGSFQNTLESYDNAFTGVEAVTFADGTVWDVSRLVDLANVPSTSHTTLYGDAASNTFDPAGIADTIYSAGTADHIIYNQGYGSLTISEDTQARDPANTIDFGPGITASMLTVTSGGGDLYIRIGESDSVTISGALDNSPYRDDIRGIQKFTFADGSSLSYEDMLALANTPSETNTTLYGDAYAQVFDSKGIANTILGGGGADTFVYKRGYGPLSITEVQGDGSSLQFDQSIDATDITLGHQSGNVTVSLGNGDVITLLNQLSDQSSDLGGVGDFVFADGTVWDREAITSRLIADSPGGPVIAPDSVDTLAAPAANDSWVFHSLPGGTISFADSDLGDLHSVTIGPVTATGATTGLDLSSFNGNSPYSDGLAITVGEPQNGNPGTIDWTFNYQNYDQGRFAYLGAGDEVTLSYVLTITDTLGRTANETVSITLTSPSAGLPEIISDTVATGAFAELVSATGSSTADVASGSIRFTDPAGSPNDTASILSVDAGGVTTGLPASAALLTMLSLSTVSQPSGGNPGSIGWTFSAADSTFDYLDDGENLTLTYVVQVASAGGGAVNQNVVVTVTGSNDLPTVSAGSTTTGAISERSSMTGSGATDTAAGSILFVDPDLSDTHGATVTGVSASGAVGGLPSAATLQTLLSLGTLVEQSGSTPGSVAWTFATADNAFDYLAAGETVTLTYAVQIVDAQGGTVEQDVAVTVTGTNDAPVTTVPGAQVVRINTPTALTGISVTDPDESTTETVSLHATAGTLSATAANGGSVSGSGTGTLTVSGSLSQVNATLGSLVFKATANGTLTINAVTSDGMASNSQSIAVTVNSTANHAPAILSLAPSASLAEASGVSGSTVADTASGNISFQDSDLPDTHSLARVSVTASGATAGLPANSSLLAYLTTGPITEQSGTTPGNGHWAFSAQDKVFDYLADGEIVTLTYLVKLADTHGGNSTQTIVVTVTGTNDAPVVATGGVVAGSITEQVSMLASATSDSVSGAVKFKDADLSDTHAIQVTGVAASGGVAGLPSNATLLSWFSAASLTEPAGTTPGSAPWAFAAPDTSFDYLAAGQKLTLTYTVQITDPHGAVYTQPVVVTVTGTDDAPIVTSGATVTGAFDELTATSASATVHRLTGKIGFTDADLTDTHVFKKASVVASGVTSGLPASATLLSYLTGIVTAQSGATPGSIAWTFAAADKVFDYLAEGETVTLVYDSQIVGSHGALVDQPITVTVTGHNDAPKALAHGYATDNQTQLIVPFASLLTGDTDPDKSDVLALSSVQAAVGGSVALDGNGNVVFTPSPTRIGTDSFTYTISDGHGGSATATASISVTLHQINGTEGDDVLTGNSQPSQINGLGGNDTIAAGSAGDTLIGGSGNDSFTGGAGIDTFAFHAGFGLDTLYGFAATGTAHDYIQVDKSMFADWAHLLGATQQVGSDLVITLDSSDTMTLKNVALSSFKSSDARFV